MTKKSKNPFSDDVYTPKVFLIAYPEPISFTEIARKIDGIKPTDERQDPQNKTQVGVTRALEVLVPKYIEYDEKKKKYFSKAAPLSDHFKKILKRNGTELTSDEEQKLKKFLDGAFRKTINLEEWQKEEVFPVDYLRHLLGLHAQLATVFPHPVIMIHEEIEESCEESRDENRKRELEKVGAFRYEDEIRLYYSLGTLGKKLSALMPTYSLPEKTGKILYEKIFSTVGTLQRMQVEYLGYFFDSVTETLGRDSLEWFQLSERLLTDQGVDPRLIGHFPDSLREKAKFPGPFFYEEYLLGPCYPIINEERFKHFLKKDIDTTRENEEELIYGDLHDNPEITIENLAKDYRMSIEQVERAFERMKESLRLFLKNNPGSTIDDISRDCKMSSKQVEGVLWRMENEFRVEEQIENDQVQKKIYLLAQEE